MAQASSVQREPSMEEILASIRRIIEDNDTGRRPAVDFGQMRPEPEEDRAERNVIEVEAFRAELQAGKNAVPAAETRADVTARSEPVEEKDDNAATPWPTIEPKRPLAPETRGAEAPVASRVAQSWAPTSTAAVEQMERLAGPVRDPSPEALAAPQPVVATPPAASPVEAAPAIEAAGKAAIISEQPARQVTAAFGELNDAYAARSRKSFDEIAADMLRPMLQDWLDNNLPTLVERLVREEIERVARGAQ
ncbi:PopZ family protein [Aminobacter sp. HY435]|uniref:PopZ family protein n=1 Tax=Aminobacter sp. HY435 TaxID=2970917 RepID=UPI0022B95702|nr:PopZ family protein [Aminobacter sp. HY435]